MTEAMISGMAKVRHFGQVLAALSKAPSIHADQVSWEAGALDTETDASLAAGLSGTAYNRC